MNEGHITTNRGGKGGECVLLCLMVEMEKYCDIKFKKEEGHITINYGEKGGYHTLLCLMV